MLRQKPAATGRHTHCGTSKDKTGIAGKVSASKRFRSVWNTAAASLHSDLHCKTATCRKRKREGTRWRICRLSVENDKRFCRGFPIARIYFSASVIINIFPIQCLLNLILICFRFLCKKRR